jgi:hypothetical protein
MPVQISLSGENKSKYLLLTIYKNVSDHSYIVLTAGVSNCHYFQIV